MKVIYAKRSQRDFERIRGWITKESSSQDVADQFISRMILSCDGLVELPRRHPFYRPGSKWRMMPFGKYVVLYQPLSKYIKVGYVRHAARRPIRS